MKLLIKNTIKTLFFFILVQVVFILIFDYTFSIFDTFLICFIFNFVILKDEEVINDR